MTRCLDDRLTSFYTKAADFNAHIQHYTITYADNTIKSQPLSQRNIPYVGNGYFGLEIEDNAKLFAKYGRHLSQIVDYKPIISTIPRSDGEILNDGKQAVVVDYINGIVHKFQCFGGEFSISHDFYAHRTIPNVFIQEIKTINLVNSLIDIELKAIGSKEWASANHREFSLRHPDNNRMVDFTVTTGVIQLPKNDETMIVSICTQKPPSDFTMKKRGVTKIDIVHVINYEIVVSATNQKINEIETSAVENITNIFKMKDLQMSFDVYTKDSSDISLNALATSELKRKHINVWNTLWESGFQISTSMADGVINGDQINATIYNVLSHVRSFDFEQNTSEKLRAEIQRSLIYAEGCFDSNPTLQAGTLWKDMNTIEESNKNAMSWLLTLEKQGCHNLIRAGASGVIQAMILSFGGFSFSNQHLELNIHPKYLHRDYFFRRLNYGNMTHINVSIEVTEENRAIMYVALDRTDGKYFACDGGCLDEPVPLTRERKMFPVKLTDPLTAILYIASDREHIEELRHAIHVKEVAEGKDEISYHFLLINLFFLSSSSGS